MSSGHAVRRVAVVAVLVLALVAGIALLLSGDSPYTVKARFQNASQLVKGNEVQVAGMPVGTVQSIDLTDDGQAEVTMTVNDEYAPLRRGSRAIVRQASLSGVANRYVDLQLGDGRETEIADGGRIRSDRTVSNVDLDQLFNIFDPVARIAIQKDLKGFAQMYAGRSEQANDAARLLNPALSSGSRLFTELNRNTPLFERFISETAKLVGDTAEKKDDLAGVVDHLATTSSALASRKAALGEAIGRLPGFMRKTNTTFVNLRAALDDLDPLVTESRPVVRRLRPFIRELRPFARDARPTVRDLSRTIRRPGADNDLIEFLGAQPAVDKIANQRGQFNGKERDGAFAEMRRAAKGAAPQIGFGRTYAPELVGWFDDFSHSGQYDALGAFSRVGLALNQFTVTTVAGGLPTLLPVPASLRQQALALTTDSDHNNRCPGAVERPAADGSNPFVDPTYSNCDPKQLPIGP
jgi:phospholipid/cholesterol/gamma-HCH transport system substrate-binding protein